MGDFNLLFIHLYFIQFFFMKINYFCNQEMPLKNEAISGKKERGGIPGPTSLQNLRKILMSLGPHSGVGSNLQLRGGRGQTGEHSAIDWQRD